MNKQRKHRLLIPLLILGIVSLACNFQIPAVNITIGDSTGTPPPPQPTAEPATPLPPTAAPETATPAPTQTPLPSSTPENTPTIAHFTRPGTMPSRLSWMWDRDSSNTASQNRPSGGDDYSRNLYERPFNAETQDRYYPDIDIQEGSLAIAGGWVYTAVKVKGPDPESGRFDAAYGVEIDLNQDGRGDWLIMAASPEADWSTDRVQVWQDSNHNVGDSAPMQADPPQNGDGYETLVFDSGKGSDPDAAWAMVSNQAPNTVLLAFKYNLINTDGQFMWGVWADRGLKTPGWFDYHDKFTAAEAGSPLPGVPNYPSKSIFAVDNTCRWTVGFAPNGLEPGLCPLPPTPTPVPPTPTPVVDTPTWVPPITIITIPPIIFKAPPAIIK
jgi:hypothetical protein